jgi:hypothetical protein
MADLPPIPPGLTRNQFGKHVMQWGTGYDAAVARIATVTRRWLLNHHVTLHMAQVWQEFYEQVYAVDPANESAHGRIALMRHCARLLGEE